MTVLYINLGIAEYINRKLSIMYTCPMRVFKKVTTWLDNLTIRNSTDL